MIRWITLLVLCLGVATLGFARPCPCDHEADEAAVSAHSADTDCPHAASAQTPDEMPTEDVESCAHCDACMLSSGLLLPASPGLAQAPAQTDFDHPVSPPRQGAPALLLRPPIA